MSTDFSFKPASHSGNKLMAAVFGPSGSGKTRWALTLAELLADNLPVAVIDTEQGRASEFVSTPGIGGFDTLHLKNFDPDSYTEAIIAAARSEIRYGALVIDSLSPVWDGKGGALDIAGSAPPQQKKHGQIWNTTINPQLRRLVAAMTRLTSAENPNAMHLIVTMRARTAYEEIDGKRQPVGEEPIMGKGIEYEFSLFGSLGYDHRFNAMKIPPQLGMSEWYGDSLDKDFLRLLVEKYSV